MYRTVTVRDLSLHTKLAVQIWPQDQFPLRRVGKLTLNQNAANFFNENEQLAFSPSHILPGEAYCCSVSCGGFTGTSKKARTITCRSQVI